MFEQCDGYVYLSDSEEREAREFFGAHEGEIPTMDEGDSICGKPITYGLEEHPITGRLMIPRPAKSRQLREMAKQVAGLTDREWKIWELHCKGNSQERIAGKLELSQRGVSKALERIHSKITSARESMRRDRTRFGTRSVGLSAV